MKQKNWAVFPCNLRDLDARAIISVAVLIGRSTRMPDMHGSWPLHVRAPSLSRMHCCWKHARLMWSTLAEAEKEGCSWKQSLKNRKNLGTE